MAVEWPEDTPMEEWVEQQMAKRQIPDPFGRTENECRLELAAYWSFRKKSFAEDLADIRNEVINQLNPDREVIGKQDLIRSLDAAMVSVMGLVHGRCPGTDKYSLNNYIFVTGKKEDGEFYVDEAQRPTEYCAEQYFKAVNT